MNKYLNKKRSNRQINFCKGIHKIYSYMEKLDLERLIHFVEMKIKKELCIFPLLIY